MIDVKRKSDDHQFPWGPILDDIEGALRELERLGWTSGKYGVVWNGLRANQPHYWDHYLDSGRTTICCETPLIGRNCWTFGSTAENNFFRLGKQDTAAVYGGYRIPAAGKNRLEWMLDLCGQEIRPAQAGGHHIVYATQVPGDAGLKGFDPYEAAIYDLYQLRFLTARPLVCAVHPDCYSGWAQGGHAENPSFVRLVDYCKRAGVRLSTKEERTSDFFDGCWAVVAKTSGVTFEALLEGIRCVALHPGNFCYGLADYPLTGIESLPAVSGRWAWFGRLAWIQWNREELRDGTALRYLLEIDS